MKTQPRDPFNTFLLWASIGSMTALAVIVAVAFPLLYLWTFGLIACFGIGLGTLVILGGMDPLCCIFFGGEILKGALYVIAGILSGLADASK